LREGDHGRSSGAKIPEILGSILWHEMLMQSNTFLATATSATENLIAPSEEAFIFAVMLLKWHASTSDEKWLARVFFGIPNFRLSLTLLP
jgi:hypothetical protein